jgi:uncharacterized protein YuzE
MAATLLRGNQNITISMTNPKMHYFPEQDVIHLAITDEDEMDSMELSPNITAELNADGDFILESTQAKLMQLKQSIK